MWFFAYIYHTISFLFFFIPAFHHTCWPALWRSLASRYDYYWLLTDFQLVNTSTINITISRIWNSVCYYLIMSLIIWAQHDIIFPKLLHISKTFKHLEVTKLYLLAGFLRPPLTNRLELTICCCLVGNRWNMLQSANRWSQRSSWFHTKTSFDVI